MQVGEETPARCAPPRARSLSRLCTTWKVTIRLVRTAKPRGIFSDSASESLSAFLISAEPSVYCPRRPRSTSEAVSLAGRDDLSRSRSKDGHRGPPPPRDAYRSPDSVHSGTSLSPQQPDEELDLCPPATGISSLDFDPMSFQCSQPAATPRLQQQHRDRDRDRGKWRKSAGCSSESEPISSPNNNNNISRTQSPDISPGLAQGRSKQHERENT